MNAARIEQFKNSPQLPSLPAIALMALEMARRDQVDLNVIANTISNDPALSTKILRTVNSSFYGLPKHVSTISHALVILGLQAVKTLALGFSLVGTLKARSDSGFDYVHHWKRSIYSAVASRLLARHGHLVQQEEAFLCGLLADMGVMVMHGVLGTDYDYVYGKSGGHHEALIDLERKTYDCDHTEVAAMLAEHWQLPAVLVEPLRHHHDGNEEDPQLKPLVEAVYVGMLCGEVFANPQPAQYIMRAREELTNRLKFTPAQIESLMAEIEAGTVEAARLFDVNIGSGRTYQDILNEANEALIQMTLQTQRQVQKIQEENQVLQQKATTDPLTGIANRARFNEFLEEQFERAFKLNRPMTVLFLDVDHFKKVNDQYGHQAGDEVLKAVGKLLKLAARNVDLAARYGGEEFALILSDTESNTGAQLADDIRQAIEAEVVHFEGNTIRITASLGVAGTDRQRLFTSAAQLTNAADRAVYAAKAAGRNCVRLFRPKVPAAQTAGG